jgi:acetyl-CoA C-acetyltransferase
MSKWTSLDPRTPVLIGASAQTQKFPLALDALQPIELMLKAVYGSVDNHDLLAQCDKIYVPQGMWAYSDPGRYIARKIGAEQCQTVLAKFGILQQTLIGDACRDISEGGLDCVLVVGGEAKFRQLRAQINQEDLSDDISDDMGVPDELLTPEDELWLSEESDAGLGMPVGYYALIESTLRAKHGLTPLAHCEQLAKRYRKFSQVAAQNPQAWKSEELSEQTLLSRENKNEMLAYPYSKRYNSSWNVDQAGALVLCSVEKARALGVPESQWIFPLVSTESNYMVSVSQRQDLSRCTGAELSAKAALSYTETTVDDLDFVELYSCFPSAVETYADALGIPSSANAERDLTITGGMPFAGGPVNNFMFQGLCRMVELMRKKPGSSGVISSVSGMLTKQAFGIWSTEPPLKPFRFIDVSREAEELDPALDLDVHYQGLAVIRACTVLYEGGLASRVVVIAQAKGQQPLKNIIAYSLDLALVPLFESEECIGRLVMIEKSEPGLVFSFPA